MNLETALEERLGKAKYLSRTGSPGDYRYKYKQAKGTFGKKPKESLARRTAKKEAAQKDVKISDKYKSVVRGMNPTDVVTLKNAMAQGFKPDSPLKLAETAINIQAGIYEDDSSYKRDDYYELEKEAWSKMTDEEQRETLIENYGDEDFDIGEMSKEKLWDFYSENLYDLADEISGKEMADLMYGSPEQTLKESPEMLAMVLTDDASSYMDEQEEKYKK